MSELDPQQAKDIAQRVSNDMPRTRADLEDLTRIPSVSLGSFDQQYVDASAERVAELLRAEGLDVEIIREGGRPAVIGRAPAPEGAPTVTLYAHHDVQPPGKDDDWESPPFEPTERDGRIYARGIADDKAGVMAHIAAIRAFGGDLPVGLNVFIEGEEEIGSDSLPTILERHGDKLDADAIVIADSGNIAVGTPSLTTTLRGMVQATVTVRTLDHALHSGIFGGPVPDAATALIRLLASLHGPDGEVAVEGLQREQAADVPLPEDRFAAEAGLLDGVELIGKGPLAERLWTGPALTVIGTDLPHPDAVSNTLQPAASAVISLRVAPGQDPQEAYDALARHLTAHAPWGARVEVSGNESGPGFAASTDSAAYAQARQALADAWQTEPVDIGIGGSIPFVASFAERFPNAAILITGVEDPDTRAHSPNESLHLAEFEKACQAEAIFLARLAAAYSG